MKHLVTGLSLGIAAALPAMADTLPERVITSDSVATYQQLNYAPAVVYANDIYLSGVSGRVFEGPDAIARQFGDAFAKLEKNLKAAGSDLSHVKEVYTWHVDLSQHAAIFLQLKDKYFPKPPYPTWTSVEIDSLAPGAKLEITARAEKIEGGDKLVYLDAPGKEAARIGYQPAVIDNGLVYLSGLSGKSQGTTVEQQFRSAFETLKAELESAGSSLDNIIELDTFHVDIAKNMDTFKHVRDKYIKKPVAWNPVGIKGIVDPGGLLEITVRARPVNSPDKIRVVDTGSDQVTALSYQGTLYVSSISSLPGKTSARSNRQQFNAVFQKLDRVLQQAGLDSSSVVELNTYHNGLDVVEFFQFVDIKRHYLQAPYPAWNGIGMNGLVDPEAKVSLFVRAKIDSARRPAD